MRNELKAGVDFLKRKIDWANRNGIGEFNSTEQYELKNDILICGA